MDVLLIDDHPLFRQGMAAVLPQLDPGCRLHEAASCAEALRLMKEGPDLDLVLLDVRLQGENGLTQLPRLRRAQPATPVVVISASDEPDKVCDAIAAGAQGFVSKQAPPLEIVQAIERVLSGEIFIPEGVEVALESGAQAGGRAIDAPDRAKLTARQIEVLQLLARGHSNREIASRLEIAEPTVRVHVTDILRSLHASNRTEAAYRAFADGWVPFPSNGGSSSATGGSAPA